MRWLKMITWHILNAFDNIVMHDIVGEILDWFPMENKDGSDSLAFIIYDKVVFKFCCWVNADLEEEWFPEDEDNEETEDEEDV